MQSSQLNPTEWRAACHEAGHAVAGIVFGYPPIAVSIDGQAHTDFDHDGRELRFQQWINTVHCGPIAGNWSEKLVHRPYDRDLETELAHARSREPLDADYGQIFRAIVQGWPGIGDRAAIAKFREDEAAMIDLVKSMWPAISAVAAELMISKTISGARLREIASRFFPVEELLRFNRNAYAH